MKVIREVMNFIIHDITAKLFPKNESHIMRVPYEIYEYMCTSVLNLYSDFIIYTFVRLN